MRSCEVCPEREADWEVKLAVFQPLMLRTVKTLLRQSPFWVVSSEGETRATAREGQMCLSTFSKAAVSIVMLEAWAGLTQ